LKKTNWREGGKDSFNGRNPDDPSEISRIAQSRGKRTMEAHPLPEGQYKICVFYESRGGKKDAPPRQRVVLIRREGEQ